MVSSVFSEIDPLIFIRVSKKLPYINLMADILLIINQWDNMNNNNTISQL